MAFTLYSLLQAALLCVNAIAVLHEERFLKNIGWGTDQGIGGFGEEPGIKSQLMNLIRSVRTVMRVPLIIINSVAIVLLLLFGWRSMGKWRLRRRDASRSYCFGLYWKIHVLAGCPWTWQKCKPDRTRVPIYLFFFFFFECCTYSFITKRRDHQRQ